MWQTTLWLFQCNILAGKTYLLILSDKSLILFDRFGASYKEDVENSRIETSKILADYCDSNPRTPKAFINMSGVGMWT